ncbi:MAG: hypothetical protein ACKVK3_08695 [Acidimicrobiales bacterium]
MIETFTVDFQDDQERDQVIATACDLVIDLSSELGAHLNDGGVSKFWVVIV